MESGQSIGLAKLTLYLKSSLQLDNLISLGNNNKIYTDRLSTELLKFKRDAYQQFSQFYKKGDTYNKQEIVNLLAEKKPDVIKEIQINTGEIDDLSKAVDQLNVKIDGIKIPIIPEIKDYTQDIEDIKRIAVSSEDIAKRALDRKIEIPMFPDYSKNFENIDISLTNLKEYVDEEVKELDERCDELEEKIKKTKGNTTFIGGSTASVSSSPTDALNSTITQTAHGFSVKKILYRDVGIYALADRTDDNKANVVGMVIRVIDANTFVLGTSGHFTGLSGFTDNTNYFLGTNGDLTATKTETLGEVQKPLFTADSTTSGYFNNERGELITGGTTPVVSVTGWNVNNADPQNPTIDTISVDGTTIQGDGDSTPLVSYVYTDSTLTGTGRPGDLLSVVSSGGSVGNPVYIWNAVDTFAKNDTVYFKGNYYTARNSNTNEQPDLFPSDWRLLLASSSGYPVYDNGTTYNSGNKVTFEGNAYQSLTTQSGAQPDNDVYNQGGNWEWVISRDFPALNVYRSYQWQAGSGTQIIGNPGGGVYGYFKPKILANTFQQKGDRLEFNFGIKLLNVSTPRKFGVYLGSDNSLSDRAGYSIFDTSEDPTNDTCTASVSFNTYYNEAYLVVKGYIELIDVAGEFVSCSVEISPSNINKNDYQNSLIKTVYYHHLGDDFYIYLYANSDNNSDGDLTLWNGHMEFVENRI